VIGFAESRPAARSAGSGVWVSSTAATRATAAD